MDDEFTQDDYTIEPKELNWQPFNEDGFASPWAPRLWRASVGLNYLFSTLVALVIVLSFVLLSEHCRHWCLIPLALCGILAGADIVAWFRKEIDAFDAKVLVAAFFYLNCFMAPLLHLHYDIYGEMFHIPDWATYFGHLGFFNAVGLILFKLSHNLFFKRSCPVKKLWHVDSAKFVLTLIPVLAISIIATLVIHLFFGGLVRAGSEDIIFAGGSEAYRYHLSWLLMLGDPLLVLLAMSLVYRMSKKIRDKPRSLLVILSILFSFAVLQLFLVGLHGGRMITLSMVFITTAIIHYRLRPFSIKLILLGIYVVFVFVFLYGFYKHLGSAGLEAIYSSDIRKSMRHERFATSPLGTLLGNFARADVQTFMLYRLESSEGSFQLVHGRSYAMAALTFIPRVIWKSKPAKNPKVMIGGEILGYTGREESSRQYGLAGEAMLNFGCYGILSAFFVFGAVLGWFRKKIATMEPSDSRFFLVPIFLITFALVINTDSDNLIFNLLKLMVLPFCVIFFGSIRSRLISTGDIA